MAESYNKGRGLRHGQINETGVYCGAPVNTSADLDGLPVGSFSPGQIRLVIGEERVYCYNGSVWQRITGSGIGGLRSIQVVDIDDPQELAAIMPREQQEILYAFQPLTGSEPATLYAWRPGGSSDGAYSVTAGDGSWVAIDGRRSASGSTHNASGMSQGLTLSGGSSSVHITSGKLRYDASADINAFNREVVGFVPLNVAGEEYVFPIFGGADPGGYPNCEPGSTVRSLTPNLSVERYAALDDWAGAHSRATVGADGRANAQSIGGYRRLVVGSLNTLIEVHDPPSSGDVLEVSTSLAGQASIWDVIWDGFGGTLTTVQAGLYACDITEAGAVGGFAFDYDFTGGSGTITITVASASGSSSASFALVPGANTRDVNFASFTVASGAGADMTRVSAVKISGSTSSVGITILSFSRVQTRLRSIMSIDTGNAIAIGTNEFGITDQFGDAVEHFSKSTYKGVHFEVPDLTQSDVRLVDWTPSTDNTVFTYDVGGREVSFTLPGRVPIRTSRVRLSNKAGYILSTIAGPNQSCFSGVTVGPAISLSSSSISFGSVTPGVVTLRSVTITNTGDSEVVIKNVRVEGPGAFHYRPNGRYANATIAPVTSNTADVTVAIEYQHVYKNDFDAVLVIETNVAGREEVRIPMIATVSPEIAVSPTSVDFTQDALQPGDYVYRTLVVSNSGTGALEITSASITSGGPNFQTYGTPDTSPVPDGFERNVDLRYAETDPTGPRSGNLRIINSDSDESTKNVALVFRDPLLVMTSPASEPAGPVGSVGIDATAPFVVTLQNVQAGITANISSVSFVGGDSAYFSLVSGPSSIGGLASGNFTFNFIPAGDSGSFATTLRFQYNNTTGGSPLDIAIEAETPAASAPASYDFGSVRCFEEEQYVDVVLSNNGTVPMTVTSVYLVGETPRRQRGGAFMPTVSYSTIRDYSIDPGFFTGGTMAASETRTIRVKLMPPGLFRCYRIGRFNCSLMIESDGGDLNVQMLCTLRYGEVMTHQLSMDYAVPVDTVPNPDQPTSTSTSVGGATSFSVASIGDGAVTLSNMLRSSGDTSRLDRWTIAVRDVDNNLITNLSGSAAADMVIVGIAQREMLQVQATSPVRLEFYHNHEYVTGQVVTVRGTGTGLDNNSYTVTSISGRVLSLNGTVSVGTVNNLGYVQAKNWLVNLAVTYDTTVDAVADRWVRHSCYVQFDNDAWNNTLNNTQRLIILRGYVSGGTKGYPPAVMMGTNAVGYFLTDHLAWHMGLAAWRVAGSYPYRADSAGTTSSAIVTAPFVNWIQTLMDQPMYLRDVDLINATITGTQHSRSPYQNTASTGGNTLDNFIYLLGFERGFGMSLASGTPGVDAEWSVTGAGGRAVGIRWQIRNMTMDGSTTSQVASFDVPMHLAQVSGTINPGSPGTLTFVSGDVYDNAIQVLITSISPTPTGDDVYLQTGSVVDMNITTAGVGGSYDIGDVIGSYSVTFRVRLRHRCGIGYSNIGDQPNLTYKDSVFEENDRRPYVPYGEMSCDPEPVSLGTAVPQLTRIFVPTGERVDALIAAVEGHLFNVPYHTVGYRTIVDWLSPPTRASAPDRLDINSASIPGDISFIDFPHSHRHASGPSTSSSGTGNTVTRSISSITKPSRIRITTSTAHNYQTGWHVIFSGTGNANLDGYSEGYGVSDWPGNNVFEINVINSTTFDLLVTESMPLSGAGGSVTISGYQFEEPDARIGGAFVPTTILMVVNGSRGRLFLLSENQYDRNEPSQYPPP